MNLKELGGYKMLSIITDATCGEACWTAKEEICKCSCGGNNHGCLTSPEGVQPNRTCKIDGFRYELVAIGKYSDNYKEGERINKEEGVKKVIGNYSYFYNVTEPGALARVKCASEIQIANWKELATYKKMERVELFHNKPYLLWKRVL